MATVRPTERGGFYRRRGKRWLDLVIAVPALLVTSPVLALAALAVRWNMGKPVLFRQPRPGREGRLFEILKLRTMRPAAPETGDPAATSDAARLTGLGKLLRRTSLDELPELWNVIRGDMSLVGPRPLLPRYLDRYSSEQARRHDIRPGITGWAQVHGRNATTWSQRLALDVWYVEHLGLGLDLRILCATLWQVVTGVGITAPGHATMPEFSGSTEEEKTDA